MRDLSDRAGLLCIVMALAGVWGSGCAKHRWLAEQGLDDTRAQGSMRARATDADSAAASYDVGDAGQSSPAVVAHRDASLRAAPTDSTPERLDPVTSGGAPIVGWDESVSVELPWIEPTGNANDAPSGETASVCARGPCYWVQVAAKLDSLGSGRLLAQARQVAALDPVQPGGECVRDQNLWKVRVGPYPQWFDADIARQRLRAGGFPEAWLVRR